MKIKYPEINTNKQIKNNTETIGFLFIIVNIAQKIARTEKRSKKLGRYSW